MSAIKVFIGNYDGTQYRMVACSSKIKAMSLLQLPATRFDKYFRVTNHPSDCEIALASPERVFSKSAVPIPGADNKWKEV